MKLVFLHHEIHGPISLEDLWKGTHGFGGSVARLRILFWLAARGNEVYLVGNVQPGILQDVTAIPGTTCLEAIFKKDPEGAQGILVLNNPPTEEDWCCISRNLRVPIVLWAGNPFSPHWLDRAKNGSLARIVCVSQYHREMYRIYQGFEAVEVVYSGVDLDLLAQADPNYEAVGSVLFCSIPRRTKGVHNLLRAWQLVRERLPHACLRVCGSARMHDPNAKVGRTGILDCELEEEFADFFSAPPESIDHSGITLLGLKSLREVYSEIKAAAVVVVNCNWRGSFETYCRAAVEAQSAGAPVIGASRGSLKEVVSNGHTGLLVEKEDPALLAEAIIRILNDPSLQRQMRVAGPAWAGRFAGYEILARAWEDIAGRALTGEKAPGESEWCGDLLRRIGFGAARRAARNLIRGSKAERLLLSLIK